MEENILEKIYRAGLRLLDQLTTEETFERIVKEAIKLVSADYGSLTLMDNDEFKDVYSTLPLPVKRRKKGYTFKSFIEQKVIVLHNQEVKDHRDRYPEMAKIGIQSVILIPLSYRKKPIGVLVVNSRKKEHFSKRERDVLVLFGSLASLAIRKTQSYDETRKALETRDLFISMASHELRTPLTAISGYIQLLQSRHIERDDTESRWINHLAWETQRLTNLVKELLEVNRIKNGNFEYFWKEGSLKTILERALGNIQIRHPDREVLLEESLTDDQALVIGDFDKLLQVFNNLLENAADFSDSTKKIVVKLSDRRKTILIAVKDQGRGIQKKDLPHIFDRFYRGEDNSKEGIGIGLFLVKDIVTRHHGTVRVKSIDGKGTTVEVILPKANI